MSLTISNLSWMREAVGTADILFFFYEEFYEENIVEIIKNKRSYRCLRN